MANKSSLIRWSSDQLHAEVKAAADLEGRSMNALLEDAAAEYVARHTGGTSAVALKSFAAAQSSYQSPTTTYRSLSESGLGHEDIINQLGGGPAPTEGEVQ